MNAPQADIVQDKLHTSKYLNKAVGKVHRAEHRDLMKNDDETLEGNKYLFLKNPINMSEAEKESLKTLRIN